MNYDAWIPNIICTVGGFVAGWVVNHWYARQSTKSTALQLRILTTLLTVEEERGHMELERDQAGNITGGRVIRLQGVAIASSMAVASLTTSPAAISGDGAVSTAQ